MTPPQSVLSIRELIDRLLALDLQRPPALGGVLEDRGLLEKLLVTVDAAPVLLAYVDSEERYRFCNERYEQWFGEARERILGRTMREVLGDASYEGIRAEVQAALSGQAVHFERAMPHLPGGTRVIQADYLPHVLADGRVAGFVGMVADVTELRRGEEAERIAQGLRESEDRLRLALTQARRDRLRADRLFKVSSELSRLLLPEDVAGVVVREGALALEALSASLVMVSADGTAFELSAAHGFPEGALEGFQRFPLDTPVMYREAVRTGRPVLYRNLEAFLQDYPALRGSPSLLGRAFAALPLQVDGRILGAFGFTFAREQVFEPETLQFMEALGQQCALALERARLYAAERQAREEAERLRDRLATERTLLEAVLDQLPVGVVIADPSGRLLRGNAAMEMLWGHSFVASAAIPEYRAYRGSHPDGTALRAEEWPLSRSLLHGEKVLREPVMVDRADGTRKHLDVSSALVRDASGRPLAGVAVSVDVTAHHELREALRREAEVRDRLMGIVGHDLRNPLQAIATSSTLLLKDGSLTPPQQKRAARILTSVRRMDHLIRDLMDFARVGREGTLPIQRAWMSLGDACRIVIDELLAAYPDRDIRLDLFGDVNGVWDLDRLVQLLGNLVVNAFTHGAQGVPVELRVDGTGDRVVLEVANAGKPIPPALLPRIFEPFTRADTGGEALRGVGLGLFIVHEIVTAHGGHIDVMSTMETGTVFQVTLPRAPRG